MVVQLLKSDCRMKRSESYKMETQMRKMEEKQGKVQKGQESPNLLMEEERKKRNRRKQLRSWHKKQEKKKNSWSKFAS